MDQLLLGRTRSFSMLARALMTAAAIALSAGAAAGQDVVPVLISAQAHQSAETVFSELVWEPVVEAKCVNCHVAGGVSGHTRLVFDAEGDAAAHLQTFADFLEAAGDDGHDHHHDHQHGHEFILVKIQGTGHGGGEQVAADSDDFDNVDRFLALLENEAEAEAEFQGHISEPVVQAKCVNCHVEGGVSGHTRLVLVRSADDDDHEASNLQAFRQLVEAVAGEGGAAYILDKVQGMPSHGGGVQLMAGSEDYESMAHFLELLEDEPQGFVARILEAVAAVDDSMTLDITTPMDEGTVAGTAVAVSASEAPTEAVHFAYAPGDDAQAGFSYLGAAANHETAVYAWDTTGVDDGNYELAAMYTEDEGDSVTRKAIDVTVDNTDAAHADIEEDPGLKEQAVGMDGALAADDRLKIEVMDFPEAAAAPGTGVGSGTVDITLDSGQSAFIEDVTVPLPYYEGRPDGIVRDTDIAETELTLWYFDAGADTWEMVGRRGGRRCRPGIRGRDTGGRIRHLPCPDDDGRRGHGTGT